jgi:hypothetical protein
VLAFVGYDIVARYLSLHARADGEWLAELLMDLEGEDGEPARLQLADALRSALT